jgi:transcriptional regulator with XRE-family HTH domain
LSTISKIAEKLKDLAYRKAYIASQINIGIPFQIRALMKARGWTQETLAEKTGMLQPRISGLMKPGKTRPNIETLRRVAEAFDCALIVRFAPFSELARWAEDFEPDSFTVPSFSNDIGFIERRGPVGDQGGWDAGIMTGTNDEVVPRAPIGTSKVIAFDAARMNHGDRSISGGV